MKIVDYILLGVIAALFALSLHNIFGSNCSGVCAGCKGCAFPNTRKAIQKRKKQISR